MPALDGRTPAGAALNVAWQAGGGVCGLCWAMLRIGCLLSSMMLLPVLLSAQSKPEYQYFRVGSPVDATTKPRAGFALMGGGTDLDEAFRWMCERANGGDFLVLRAAGTDAYNPYIAGLEDGKSCKLNSVATLVIPSREAATNPNDP